MERGRDDDNRKVKTKPTRTTNAATLILPFTINQTIDNQVISVSRLLNQQEEQQQNNNPFSVYTPPPSNQLYSSYESINDTLDFLLTKRLYILYPSGGGYSSISLEFLSNYHLVSNMLLARIPVGLLKFTSIPQMNPEAYEYITLRVNSIRWLKIAHILPTGALFVKKLPLQEYVLIIQSIEKLQYNINHLWEQGGSRTQLWRSVRFSTYASIEELQLKHTQRLFSNVFLNNYCSIRPLTDEYRFTTLVNIGNSLMENHNTEITFVYPAVSSIDRQNKLIEFLFQESGVINPLVNVMIDTSWGRVFKQDKYRNILELLQGVLVYNDTEDRNEEYGDDSYAIARRMYSDRKGFYTVLLKSLAVDRDITLSNLQYFIDYQFNRTSVNNDKVPKSMTLPASEFLVSNYTISKVHAEYLYNMRLQNVVRAQLFSRVELLYDAYVILAKPLDNEMTMDALSKHSPLSLSYESYFQYTEYNEYYKRFFRWLFNTNGDSEYKLRQFVELNEFWSLLGREEEKSTNDPIFSTSNLSLMQVQFLYSYGIPKYWIEDTQKLKIPSNMFYVYYNSLFIGSRSERPENVPETARQYKLYAIYGIQVLPLMSSIYNPSSSGYYNRNIYLPVYYQGVCVKPFFGCTSLYEYLYFCSYKLTYYMNFALNIYRTTMRRGVTPREIVIFGNNSRAIRAAPLDYYVFEDLDYISGGYSEINGIPNPVYLIYRRMLPSMYRDSNKRLDSIFLSNLAFISVETSWEKIYPCLVQLTTTPLNEHGQVIKESVDIEFLNDASYLPFFMNLTWYIFFKCMDIECTFDVRFNLLEVDFNLTRAYFTSDWTKFYAILKVDPKELFRFDSGAGESLFKTYTIHDEELYQKHMLAITKVLLMSMFYTFYREKEQARTFAALSVRGTTLNRFNNIYRKPVEKVKEEQEQDKELTIEDFLL